MLLVVLEWIAVRFLWSTFLKAISNSTFQLHSNFVHSHCTKLCLSGLPWNAVGFLWKFLHAHYIPSLCTKLCLSGLPWNSVGFLWKFLHAYYIPSLCTKLCFLWIAVERCWISVEVSTCPLHSKFIHSNCTKLCFCLLLWNSVGLLWKFLHSNYIPSLYKAVFSELPWTAVGLLSLYRTCPSVTSVYYFVNSLINVFLKM